jgi:hypothetical protein
MAESTGPVTWIFTKRGEEVKRNLQSTPGQFHNALRWGGQVEVAGARASVARDTAQFKSFETGGRGWAMSAV